MQQKNNHNAVKRLHDWLEAKNLSQRDFSKLINIRQSWLSLLLRGKKIPTLRQAVEIEKATKGYIRPENWLTEQIQEDKNDTKKKAHTQKNKKKAA